MQLGFERQGHLIILLMAILAPIDMGTVSFVDATIPAIVYDLV